jgi:hypothetical protein
MPRSCPWFLEEALKLYLKPKTDNDNELKPPKDLSQTLGIQSAF